MKKLIAISKKTTGQGVKSSLVVLLGIAVTLMPTLSYGQATPPPPTGGSGGGSLPDSPLGVPFDWKLNLLLVAAGIVFAVMTLRKKVRLMNTAHSITK